MYILYLSKNQSYEFNPHKPGLYSLAKLYLQVILESSQRYENNMEIKSSYGCVKDPNKLSNFTETTPNK